MNCRYDSLGYVVKYEVWEDIMLVMMPQKQVRNQCYEILMRVKLKMALV